MPTTVHHGAGSSIKHSPQGGGSYTGVVSNGGNTLELYLPAGGDTYTKRTYEWNATLGAWVRTDGGSTWIVRYFSDGTYTKTQDGTQVESGTHQAVA